jgi:hypothetical protein
MFENGILVTSPVKDESTVQEGLIFLKIPGIFGN